MKRTLGFCGVAACSEAASASRANKRERQRSGVFMRRKEEDATTNEVERGFTLGRAAGTVRYISFLTTDNRDHGLGFGLLIHPCLSVKSVVKIGTGRAPSQR